MSILQPPSLVDLTNALSNVAANWEQLGLQLHIPPDELNIIKVNNPQNARQCMSATLQWWQAKHPEQGWTEVWDALRMIERNDIANEVATKYRELILQ